MKKIYALLSVFLVIAFVSGGYALFNGEGIADMPSSDVNDNSQPSNAPASNVSEIAPINENSLNAITDILAESPKANAVSKYILSINGKDYVNSSQDFTDKYSQCAECGGFVALGEVTKEIPQAKKCTCSKELAGVGHLNADDYYVYSYEEVMHYLTYGDFPDSVNERKNIYDNNIKAQIAEIISHYKVVPGYEDTYVNEMQDFTDKYVKCYECEKYIPLGSITNSLADDMICNHSNRGHSIAYLDTNIWGVMDYNKVIGDMNNQNTGDQIPAIEDKTCKTMVTSSNMESSLVMRQGYDCVIYPSGLWGEKISDNTVIYYDTSNHMPNPELYSQDTSVSDSEGLAYY